MKAKLIINPTSGRTKRKMPPLLKWTLKKLKNRIINIPKRKTSVGEIIEEVKKVCEKEKIILDVELTKYPKHAMMMAKKAKNIYDLVIVAGGDGTINEVINGINNSKTTLVIIPFGTANVLALELGIPFNIKESTRLISDGRKIIIDLGYAKTKNEGRFFSMMLGAGFDASVINNISTKFKKRWGGLAYYIAGIKHLFSYKWHNMKIKHENKKENKNPSEGYLVIIANSKLYAGEYQIADKADINDGFLDLIIINRKKFRHIIPIIFSLAIGKMNNFLKGEYKKTKKAHVSSKEKIFVQVDGELIGTTPVKVKVVPKALKVMVKK